YLAPMASKGFNEFTYKYLKKGRADRDMHNVFRQINDNDYIYVSNFNSTTRVGTYFTLEHFEGNELQHKISANRIRFNPEDSTYTLFNYVKREIGKDDDRIFSVQQLDTVLPFEMDELTPVNYIAETLNIFELNDFIEKETKRGSSYINRYNVVWHKRWSLPVSAYILTIIAVAVSSKKRRGGMGVNLAIGITIGMVYIFFDKIFGTMAEQSDFSPFIATWFPNMLFGVLAIYLLYDAKR
ncbi:MAG TPA: LptF/LptG family permease, partial [Flavobacteriaceae bacterium]|nr:LptF/LptG family permease [Flavobacteriaceae bacterium]